jgi:hypothetical protein
VGLGNAGDLAISHVVLPFRLLSRVEPVLQLDFTRGTFWRVLCGRRIEYSPSPSCRGELHSTKIMSHSLQTMLEKKVPESHAKPR